MIVHVICERNVEHRLVVCYRENSFAKVNSLATNRMCVLGKYKVFHLGLDKTLFDVVPSEVYNPYANTSRTFAGAVI